VRNINKVVIPALIAGLGVSGLLPTSTAYADTITSLPITSFHQIVADVAHGHLFISQGSSSLNEIIVTNLAGKEVATIAGQDGVTGIALSPDGSTLYAALASSHAVTAISTTTLQQTASYPVGDANTPVDVAVQSGKVWVSYNTGTVPPNGAIGDINLSANPPAFETQAAMGGWSSAPQVAADPHDTGVLVAVEPGQTPGSVASYNVSVDPATVRAQSNSFLNCENEGDLAVVPGGSQFILACGFPYAHYRYSTADLSQQGSYASTNYPDAVAIDANGDVAAGIASNESNPDIYIYHQGGDTPLNTYNLGSTGANLMPRGLAWAADGSKLFAVLQTSIGASTFSLQVIDDPTLIQSALSLTGPSIAYITRSVTLAGKLTLGTGAPLPGGTPVTIARSVAGGTTIKKFTVTTRANGSFTLQDTPPALGKYTYAASYNGSTTIAPATASHIVTVTRIPTSLTVTTSPTTFIFEPTIHVTAHLGTTYTDRTVAIYAQRFGSRSRVLLKVGRVNSGGTLTVSYVAPHSTTFSAVFSGDARYAPKTVTHAAYVRAKVSESLSGYYGSRRIGGTTYRLFHRNNLLHAHGAVAPNKRGQCVEFEVHEHYLGAWHANVITGCIHLSSSSQAFVAFGLTMADIGFPYRIRADYIRSSKDTSNLSNDSAWQYLMVEH
jgi:hypothetical protein